MALPEDLQRIQAMLNQANPTMGAEDVRDLPLAQARNTVDQFNELQRELDAFLQTIQNVAAPRIEAANEEIDERYEKQLKKAVDFETQQAIRTQMEAEKTAQSQQIMQTARAAVDAQRAKDGQKSFAQIQSEVETIQPQVQAAQSKLAALQTGDPTRPSTQGLSSIESAERVFAQQRSQKAQRDLNVIQAMEAAEGDPEAMEQFISNVERIQDPRLQNETVQMISRLGFAAARPIKLNQGGSVQPMAQQTGGGFATMPDGTVRVYMPDGGTQTVDSEMEAQELLNGFVDLDAAPSTDRSQVKAQLQNQLAQDQSRLSQFMGGTNQGQPSENPSVGQTESQVSRPNMVGAPKLDEIITNLSGDLVAKGKSLVTGEEETEEERNARMVKANDGASALGLVKKFSPTVRNWAAGAEGAYNILQNMRQNRNDAPPVEMPEQSTEPEQNWFQRFMGSVAGASAPLSRKL